MKDEELDPLSNKGFIPLKSNKQGFIALAHNPVMYARTKYIDIQYYYI